MSDNDKNFIRSTANKRPSLEIFETMVKMLGNAHKELDRLISLTKEVASPTAI